MNDYIFIIQARTNSSRFPGKMVKEFYENQTIPEIIIQRLKNYFPDIPIVVVTTVTKNDDLMVQRLKKKCTILRGDENNVLQRFIDVQEQIQSKAIIRICADNPFLDVVFIEELINSWEPSIDYLSHKINDKPVIKTAFGFFCELTTFSTLEKVKSLTSTPFYLEHVTNYIYEHPNDFKLNWIQTDKILEKYDLRLTVDTETDFKMTQDIYSNLCKLHSNWGYKEVLNYVEGSQYLEIMSHGNEQNAK